MGVRPIILSVLLGAATLQGGANPFTPFVGEYRVTAAICSENGVEYVDGCEPDAVALESLGPDTFRLTEKLSAPYASHTQTLSEHKIDTPAQKSEARFASNSKRNASWSLVVLDAGTKREERIAIALESSKDGQELNYRRLLSERGRNLIQARNYFLEAIK